MSNTSWTYPGSKFGSLRVDDEVRLRYPTTLLSLSGQAVGRLWVVGYITQKSGIDFLEMGSPNAAR